MVLERAVGGTLADRASTALAKPRRRHDSLPENTRYRDDGCSISESCFDCPLPRCRYEEPGGLRAVLNSVRDEEMTQLRLAGMSVEDLAGHFSVSRRTVFRVIGGLKPSVRMQKPDPKAPIPIRPAIERKEAYCA
jgi:hypothetical protein